MKFYPMSGFMDLACLSRFPKFETSGVRDMASMSKADTACASIKLGILVLLQFLKLFLEIQFFYSRNWSANAAQFCMCMPPAGVKLNSAEALTSECCSAKRLCFVTC